LDTGAIGLLLLDELGRQQVGGGENIHSPFRGFLGGHCWITCGKGDRRPFDFRGTTELLNHHLLNPIRPLLGTDQGTGL